MRSRRGDEPETYYLTCPVCGALPGTSCIEDYQELARVHPSRRMSVAERNRRHAATGWEPPELAGLRLRERGTGGTALSPHGAGTAPGGRPAQGAEPCGEPGTARPSATPAPGPACHEDRTTPRAGTQDPGADETARTWFAAYLGGFPEHAAVPRWQLRDAAGTRWPGTNGRSRWPPAGCCVSVRRTAPARARAAGPPATSHTSSRASRNSA